MSSNFRIAIFFIAAFTAFTGAGAASVYKCGNSYSQVPCSGAVEINTATGPTALRQKEAQKAVQEEKKAAQTMEKERLAEEKAAVKAQQESEKARLATVKAEEKEAAAAKKKKLKEPQYFTAKTPATKASQPK
jgi:hypothetical protein